MRRHIRRIKDVLTKEQTQIVNTALWLMIPSLLTKVTGQLYQLIIAFYYGTGQSIDPETGLQIANNSFNKFLIAGTIPELLTNILLVGAIGSAILPFLILSKKEDGEKKFFKLYSSVINITLVMFTFLSFLLIITADIVFPSFYNLFIKPTETAGISASDMKDIVNTMRFLLFPQLILGLSMFISTGLNIYDRYILPQLSPLFFNLGRVLSIFFFVPFFDKGIAPLIIGTYVGAILHLIIQIPVFKSLNIKYSFIIDLKNKYLKEIYFSGIFRLFTLASDQIAFAFNTLLASAFAEGISAFNFAKSLYIVIPSIFGYTFSYASYPTLSRLVSEKKFPEIKQIVNKTLNQIAFLSIPFIVATMVLRVPIVRLTYGIIPGTSFDLQDSYNVAWILLGFSFGLLFITARWFLLSLFYAFKDTKTPFFISLFSFASVIIFSYLFTNLLSYNKEFAISAINFEWDNFLIRSDSKTAVAGISFSISLVYSIEFMALLLVFNLKKVKLGLMKLMLDISKKLLAGLAMFIFVYLFYKNWNIVSYSPENKELISFSPIEVLYILFFFVNLVGTLLVGYLILLKNRRRYFYLLIFGNIFLNLIFATIFAGTYSRIFDVIRSSASILMLLLTFITLVPGFLIYYLISNLFRVEELVILRKYLNPIFKLGGLQIR